MTNYRGIKSDFSLVRQDYGRTIVCFNIVAEPDGEHYTWCEVFWYKKPHPVVTIEDVKSAIITDVNADTTRKIVETFAWNGKLVWLSETNQHNYKAAYDLAVQTDGKSLPFTIKVGEEDKPEYITFDTLAEFGEFYTAMLAHINKCIEDGWKVKDGCDWDEYERLLNELYNQAGE